MNGILIINKPKGITSLSACNKIKYKLGLDKCGHSGTLDPNATGVLVIATNRATKLLKLINEHDKKYIATICFGYDSNTLDFDGEITNEINMKPTLADIELAMEKLANETMQLPPMTSAIKVNGKKLYEYQRKGIEIEVHKRPIKIYSSKIVSEPKLADNHYEIDIMLYVSKGFYVRSYARDLGRLLGGCAILKDLNRIMAGDFLIDDAKNLDEIKLDDIMPIDEVFKLPRVEVNSYIAGLVKNGVTLDERQTKISGSFFVTHNDNIIAVYEETDRCKYKPILIL